MCGDGMNKKHWITLTPGDSLDEALVRELVTESYLIIVSKLPKKQRPIVPRELLPGGSGLSAAPEYEF